MGEDFNIYELTGGGGLAAEIQPIADGIVSLFEYKSQENLGISTRKLICFGADFLCKNMRPAVGKTQV